MSNTELLDINKNKLISNEYDYAYIDDKTVMGTINANDFKDIEIIEYSYNKNGINVGPTFFLSNALKDLRLMGVDVSLLKKTPITVKTLYPKQQPYFFPNKNMNMLYLLKDRKIVGYIKGNTNSSELTELKNFEDYTHDKYGVYIDYVFIDEKFRNKKLCKTMVQLFLLNVNLSANANLSFLLLNAGNSISCKCYFDAFNECEYNTFSYQYDSEEDKLSRKLITRDNCIIHEMYMGFVHNGFNGGKHKKIKKNKKTKKHKK